MRIAIIGYGRMGKTIEKIALEKGHEVPLKIDLDNQADLNEENLSDIDVAIEFTTPATAFDNVCMCLNAGVPVISGTTAWQDKMDEAKTLCYEKSGAMIVSSNFSIGVNLFFALNKKLAKMMQPYSDYQLQMSETHHTKKLDAPSGTAITLAEGIMSVNQSKSKWVNEATTSEDTIPIISIREPDVPGTHVINYKSEIDSIEIKHEAYSRIGFASGALLAAEWIIEKVGVFDMKDVLGL